MSKFFKISFLGFFIYLTNCQFSSANQKVDTLNTQIGGLKFLSKQVFSSERTSLSLFPNKIEINSDFNLSFECNLYDMSRYGYVFRIIGYDNGKAESKLHLLFINRIEEIANSDNDDKSRLELYSPITNKKIIFPLTEENPKELQISIRYNATKKEVLMSVNGVGKTLPEIYLSNEQINIIFGLWGKNNDVAAMHLRNVRIREKGETKYFWPLNEYDGNYAEEKVHGLKSNVENPVWLRNQHFYWEKLESFEMDEMVGIVFKQKSQKIHLVNKDSMVIFSPQQQNYNVVKYSNQRPFLREYHYSIYNEQADEIISYNFTFFSQPKDKQFYSVFNDQTLTWSDADTSSNYDVKFHHSLRWNKDSEKIITFGGYGDFDYFNEFDTYDFSTNTWSKIEIEGDEIYPRTHSVMGMDDESGVFYLYGGFGNEEGKQEAGGRTFYDLYKVDLKNKKSEKLLDFENEDLDFVPRGQLLVDNGGNDFYTLGSKMIENAFLRLYHINLEDQKINAVTDSIPAIYSNMAGDAFLFKDDVANELYAVVRENYKELISLVTIYRLRFPPSTLVVDKRKAQFSTILVFSLIASILVIGLIVGFILTKRRRTQKALVEEKSSDYIRENKNAIWFLGGYKVFDPKGKDITYRFSKKLKELFILVFFETVNNDGINSNNLSENLWPGMDKTHQKNNRGVTINNLRKALEDLNGIRLVNVNNKWKIECDDECYFDFLEVKKSLDNKDVAKDEFLVSMFSFGNTLPHQQFEWLDKFKLLYENEALSSLYRVCNNYYVEKKYLSCFETAQIIHSKFDSLDEMALRFKIKALNKMKSQSKAHEEYELFKKRYFSIYKEQYKLSFNEIENSHYNSNE